MSAKIQIPEYSLRHVLEAIETFEAELEQLEVDEPWYVPDSRDRLDSAKQILHDHLGIQDEYYDEEDEDAEPRATELLHDS
jgi:hypothetical protein